MSLGGPVIRQHVVEFIRGTGVKTDGVVDATSTNGPWTWTVPAGVVDLMIDGCGAGQSGAAGAYQASALSAGGGAGGTSGMVCRDYRAKVVPGASLTVTIGAGGTGAATADGTYANGGNTTVAGLLPNFLTFNNTLELRGGGSYLSPPTSSTSAVATTGGNNSTAGSDGQQGVSNEQTGFYFLFYYINIGSQGGGGKASGAAGANGGFTYYSYTQYGFFPTSEANWFTVATGTTAGGVSMGGGGRGTPSFFSGVSPAGGGGDAVGTSAGSGDYGAGGGGGGGSGTARRKGGDGGNGYVQITYWSAD
jgi:hypothetical protein